MYCRCPGGILVESCCNVPGGFEKHEPKERLGTKLHLPPRFENRREEILAELEPIRVPEIATGLKYWGPRCEAQTRFCGSRRKA